MGTNQGEMEKGENPLESDSISSGQEGHERKRSGLPSMVIAMSANQKVLVTGDRLLIDSPVTVKRR